MLAHSVSADNILIAVILAILIPRLVQPFITRTPHIHWRQAIHLFFVVLWDIVVSNIRVAKLVLGIQIGYTLNGIVYLWKPNMNRSIVSWR